MVINPTVQWVGGKGRLIERIHKHLPEEYNTYHELFLGGGSLLLSLQPDKAFCYELNDNLCNLYHVIKTDKDNLISKLKEIEKEYLEIDGITEEGLKKRKEFYLDIRKKFNEETDKFQKSVYFKFINKTCFNAVYRENQKGGFNVPFGKGRDPNVCDEENILALSKYLNENEIHILHKDFEQSFENIKEGDFVYLDPPYYPLKDNSFTGYTKLGFGKTDHERLIAFCKKLTDMKVKFILSNSNCDFIKNHFQEDIYTIEEMSVARTLNSNKDKRSKTNCEIIIKNY